MANIKFSDFTAFGSNPVDASSGLVAYKGTDNIQFTPAELAPFTGLYAANGTLASNRTITMDGSTLTLDETGAFNHTVVFSGLTNAGMSITGSGNYIVSSDGTYSISSTTNANVDSISLQTTNGAGANASILIDSRSPGANADLHLKTATKLKIDLPVAATVGYVLKADDTAGNVSWAAETDTTYNVFTGADGSNPGTTGLVPQPAAADNVKFLTGAATWATPTNTTYSTFTYDSGAPANSTSGLVPAPTTSGDNTKFLRGDGTWVTPTDTTDNAAGNAAGQLQYTNGSGVFQASANLTFDAVNDILTVQDNIVIKGDGSSEASKLRFNCWNNNHYVDVIGPDHGNSPLSYSITLPNKIAPQSAVSGGRVLEVNASGVGNWIDTPTDNNTNIANTDLTLNSSRILDLAASQNLTFTGSGTSKVTFSNLGGVEIARDLTVQRNVIIQGQGYSELNAMTANTFAPDWNGGNVQSVTLTQASTFAPTNPKAGATYILIVTNTNAAITWGSYIKWAAPDTQAAPPELSGSGKTDVITLICYDGSTTNGLYYGSITKDLS